MPGWSSYRSAFNKPKMKLAARAAVAGISKWFQLEDASKLFVGGAFQVDFCDSDGKVYARRYAKNMCCTAAMDNLLNVYFGGATPLAGIEYTYFSLGLIDNAAFSSLQSGDTLASHAGWAEATYYSNSTRPQWVPSASTGGSNSIVNPNTVNFNVNANTKAVYGLFLVLGTAAAAPGAVGTDMLFATAAFAGGVQGCNSGDTLKSLYTMSIATG